MRHATALAMLTVSFAAGGEAMADCTPAEPVDNTIVTCTGPWWSVSWCYSGLPGTSSTPPWRASVQVWLRSRKSGI